MAEPAKLPSIGEQIRTLRRERVPRMSQEQLAHRAGVSPGLVRKLEQGRKQTASWPYLQRIAGALDVDVTALLVRPSRIDLGTGGEPGQDDGGMLAVREAITALWVDEAPARLEDLERSASHAWRSYWTNQFDQLGRLLPSFITAGRATAKAYERQEGERHRRAFVALADAYGAAASMLVHLGAIDLAYVAMERALDAAERSGDELRHGAAAGWMSWLLLHLTGAADGVQDPGGRGRRSPLSQARRLATETADELEPKLGKASGEHLSVWGSLLVSSAVAAARDADAAEADDILNLAEATATRMDAPERRVRLEYQSPFGPPLVIMQQADVAVVTERPGRALRVAQRMPREPDLPLASRARHLADVAFAQTQLGKDRAATDTLPAIERSAPNWIRYQPYPRMIVAELLGRERRARTPGCWGLAAV
jgi:transcriptional regulator with XRE-family HTH domain